jgi:hypothetical protein
MAISPEQRAILIERLKKAQEAKRVKAEARKAAAAAPAPPSPPSPKAEPKPPKVEKPKPAPKPAAPKVEKVDKREIEEKEEIENEELPQLTPVVQEIYHADRKGTFVEITALPPYGEPEMLKKRSKPIDIPVTPKASKDKGYMKLKFYKEPTPRVLKKIMKIHDESSSEEEEEEERLPPPPPQPSQADAKRQHMKELANYYFNYY